MTTTEIDAPAKGRVHHDGHDTEHAAADSVYLATGRLRRAVLVLIKARGSQGLTDDEGGEALRSVFNIDSADRLTFGRRRNELVIRGLVQDSGMRRRTPAGRQAIAWIAAPQQEYLHVETPVTHG